MIRLLTILLVMQVAIVAHASSTLEVIASSSTKFYFFLNGQQINQEPSEKVVIPTIEATNHVISMVFENPDYQSLTAHITLLDNYDVKVGIKPQASDPNSFELYEIESFVKENAVTMEPNMVTNSVSKEDTPPVQTSYIKKPGINMNVDFESASKEIAYTRSEVKTTNTTVIPTKTQLIVQDGMGNKFTIDKSTANNQFDPVIQAPTEDINVVQEEKESYSQELPEEVLHTDYQDPIGANEVMSTHNFNQLINTLAVLENDEEKLVLAQQAITGVPVSVNQVIGMMQQFTRDESKIAFAKYAYTFCKNKEEFAQVQQALDADRMKELMTELGM